MTTRNIQNPQDNLKNQGSNKSENYSKSATNSTSSHSSNEDTRTHGKQGFASMPKEKVREIAAEGGRHSHDNDNKR